MSTRGEGHGRQAASQSDEKYLQSHQIITNVVERRWVLVVALGEGHGDPDQNSCQPVDISVEGEICAESGCGCTWGWVERIGDAIKISGS